MIVPKVPYSSPNNPFPHSLLRTRQSFSGVTSLLGSWKAGFGICELWLGDVGC